MTYYPPFIVVHMPLNKDGNGPASPEETVKVVWEVWDSACQTVSVHDHGDDALTAQAKITRQYQRLFANVRVRFLFAWYDFWVGFYWDRKTSSLYFLPVPMCGIVITF